MVGTDRGLVMLWNFYTMTGAILVLFCGFGLVLLEYLEGLEDDQ